MVDLPNRAPAEGVVRFRAAHRSERLPKRLASAVRELAGWRHILRRLELIGRDPQRYDGYSFGNLSLLVGAPDTPRGQRAFLVSGTQTSHEAEAPLSRWALVEQWDFAENRVTSRGEAAPSSEALTHAALYDLEAPPGAVFHVHAPRLWHHGAALGLPTTSASAECGTVEMAVAVRELAGEAGPDSVLIMGGHADGVLAYGADPGRAGTRLLERLAAAWARDDGP